jgi:hypothetical protein
VSLSRYGKSATSVFDLLGRGEVDLTASLAWAIEACPSFATALWTRLAMPGDIEDLDVALEVADKAGRTDLELRTHAARVVIEAKKGWLLPGETQLTKYIGRFEHEQTKLIVSLSDSSVAWADRQLPSMIGDVHVRHVPWDEVRSDVRTARRNARNYIERLWLDQFADYLAGATAVRDPAEQWVYVVSVGAGFPREGGPHSLRDFVKSERAYFHPFGKHWPKRPPVFMGFRWKGRLQQVNRVTKSEVVPTLHARWSAIPEVTQESPYAVYDLGPDIPVAPLLGHPSLRSRRLWALLDQLLTQDTILGAERESKALTEPLE